MIIHNSHDLRYRSPFGACRAGSSVTLSLLAEDALGAQLNLWGDGFPEKVYEMQQLGCTFSVMISLPEKPCVLFYYFTVDYPEKTLFYGNNPECQGGEGQLYEESPASFQISVYHYAPVPEWFKNAVVYQIFPDRFARSSDFDPENAGTLPDVRGGVEREIEPDWNAIPVNEFNSKNEIRRWKFYGGSLKGIEEKLDYLESLGVTAIYLNPIFLARSTHRYDTADYMEIDPVLGREEDFINLAASCAEHNIRLILDGVFNHCGADSRYFDYFNQFHKEEGIKGAYHYSTSPYRSWFTFQPHKPGYRCWWNIADLPDFDTSNKDYVNFITGENGVLKKWLRLGASGWRLDVADELPNDFLKAIRKSIKEESEDYLLLGEVWDDPSNKYNYGCQMEYFWGEELDSTMNYPFRAAVLPFVTGSTTAFDFCRAYMSMAENYPPENFYASLNLLGSHDRERVANILGGYPIAKYGFDHETEYFDLDEDQYSLFVKRYKMLSIMQYFLPGVPDIYYGDETGVQGGSDPDCRRTYPWGNEDQDLIAHFQWLGKYYHAHPCLKDGGFSLFPLTDDILAIERFNKEERLTVIINRSEHFTDISYKGESYTLWPYGAVIL